ncbi:MAG: type I DNA topoisomerase [Patescibacteria group bacterium]
MSDLIIVESPTKAKTISGFLGKGYKIESSYGHVRDLPKSKLGVDVDNDFEPSYVVPTKAKKIVTKLKGLASKADHVYFATDEDREGEAISWHLQYLLKVPANKQKRIAFHEITKKAIVAALEHPRELDKNLVDAQQARRILDRLVGYKLSPLLWKKVARGLSAGRVQSAALRLIIDRENERNNFKIEEYWTVEGLVKKDESEAFAIAVWQKDGKTLDKFDLDKAQAEQAVADIEPAQLVINSVEAKEMSKNAPAPFTTSTLQQEANRRFGYSAKQTMMLAQQLYEGIALGDTGHVGLITYMRTDSYNLSPEFISSANQYIKDVFGEKYTADGGRQFKKKTKLAQEAHEAIRPTDVSNTPEELKPYLDSKQHKIYSLIWQRAMASQMANAIIETTTVIVAARQTPWTLKTTGSVIKFPGWQKVYATKSEEQILPPLAKDDVLQLQSLEAKQHFTTPPARYSEAGLVRAMEKLGIGRPSTYAPTIATLVERKYVNKVEKRLAPTEIGTIVNNLLVEHFPDIIDYNFTAEMENDLDKIASGKKTWQPIIKNFYMPFIKNVQAKEQELDKKEITETATDQVCEKCGSPMIIKLGRFGRFLACSNYPDCKNTKPLDENGDVQEPEKTNEVCPNCGSPMISKTGRFGRFLACSNYPDCKTTKKIEKGTGVICPKCHQGEMVARKGRGGKFFYTCNKYPDCQHIVWSKPTGEYCPECQQLLIMGPKDSVKCEACDYKK